MPIHSEVPEEVKTTKVRQIVQELLERLPLITGLGNIKTAPQLMRILGHKADATCQPLRHAAKIVLLEYNIPIVSCSRGFFIATKPEELERFRENLVRRIQGLQRDIGAINAIQFPERQPKPRKDLFE